jgi:riboflavin synthase
MFTGIVGELGEVDAVERSDEGARLRVQAELAADLEPGGSVSVAGACLTAAELDGGAFAADVMNQTLSLTTLGDLEVGDRVNLEAALRAGDALGGHLVQGHVDGVGEVTGVARDGVARRVRVHLPVELSPYVVEHGSIAIDGVSLTVAGLDGDEVEVSLIPETLERTTLGALEEGRRVNVEVDQIARYVERLMPSLGGQPTTPAHPKAAE